MKTSSLCLFTLLIIGISTQVKCQIDNFIIGEAVQLLEGSTISAVSSIVKDVQHNLNGNKQRVLQKAQKALSSLNGKNDLCSLKKSAEIRSKASALEKSAFCFDLKGLLSNTTQFVNNTVNVTLTFAYDIGNVTTGITNCTKASDRVQCLLDMIQALEDDANDIFPRIGKLVSEICSIVLNFIKSILQCIHGHNQLENQIDNAINYKCTVGEDSGTIVLN